MPLGNDFTAVVSAQGQFSFSRLITGEQVSFGGTQIGRGYDPGAITGDHGIGASAELRYDIRFSDEYLKAIEPYVYFDAAHRRVYVSGGRDAETGSIFTYQQKDSDHYELIGKLPTRQGAQA